MVNGILGRRQFIAHHLEVVQGRVRQLVIEIETMDVAIRLFRPDAPVGAVWVQPISRRHVRYGGESTHMIMGALNGFLVSDVARLNNFYYVWTS